MSLSNRVLIVEDEVDLAEMLKEELVSQNYEVKVANNGEAALEILRSGFNPDLVMSDLSMPRMDGMEFLKQAFLLDPHLYVIMLTGFGESERIVKCLQLGCKDYITKPFRLTELMDKIIINIEMAKVLRAEQVNFKKHHLMRVRNSSRAKKVLPEF